MPSLLPLRRSPAPCLTAAALPWEDGSHSCDSPRSGIVMTGVFQVGPSRAGCKQSEFQRTVNAQTTWELQSSHQA